MKLTLIRHSQTILNKDINSKQWVLSDTGVIFAKDLAKTFSIKDLDIIYSSLQNKALETAVILAKENNTQIGTEADLTELTSITNGFIEDYSSKVGSYLTGEITSINDGERLEEGIIRFRLALERIVNLNPDAKNIGIVSHGTMLSLFSSQYVSKSALEIHSKIQMPDVAVFDWDKKEFINNWGE